MPIPSVRPNEKQREFISRCYTQIKDEYPKAQGFGICYSVWKEKEKPKKK
jgi:hypothetical protein